MPIKLPDSNNILNNCMIIILTLEYLHRVKSILGTCQRLVYMTSLRAITIYRGISKKFNIVTIAYMF